MDNCFLQIISGVQVGRKVRVGEGVTMGRSPDNAICFSGPDGSLVSGKHAVIEKSGDDLVLRDLGSTNGTFVNGEQVTEHMLSPDEIISLGVSGPKLRLMVKRAGAGDTTTMKPVSGQLHGDAARPGPAAEKPVRTEFEGKPSKPGKPAPAGARADAGAFGAGSRAGTTRAITPWAWPSASRTMKPARTRCAI